MHTRTSILASMPDSVEKRIAKIKSKVAPELLDSCSEKDKMLINAADILQQQNEILARGQDETNGTLEEVREQTTKTNGTVKEHDAFITDYKRSAAKRTRLMVGAVPFLVVGLEVAAHKLGWL